MKQGFESGAPENVQSATRGTTPAIRTAAGRDALTGGSNRWRLAVALVCVAVAIPLAAQQTRVYKDGNAWVEETTGTMPSARELRVNTDLGSIEVQGSTPRFTYMIRKRSYAGTKEEALRQFQMMKVSTGSVGEAALLEGRMLHRNMNRFAAEITMEVPRDLQKLRLDTGAGAMAVRSIGAMLIGKTGAGAVKLDDIGGPVTITTTGGDVSAGNLGSDVSIIDGGGAVHVDKAAGFMKIHNGGGKVFVGSAKGLMVDTGAGNIEVQKCGGDLKASTGGGSLYLGDVLGTVRVDSSGGSVRLASAKGRVQVSTGGGNVELFKLSRGAQVDTGAGAITVQFIGGKDSFSESSLRTAAGDITVTLPSTLAVTVHASSDLAPGYGIKSAFPELRISSEGSGVGPHSMWAEGNLNGGGPLLRVRTTIGHIDFQRE